MDERVISFFTTGGRFLRMPNHAFPVTCPLGAIKHVSAVKLQPPSVGYVVGAVDKDGQCVQWLVRLNDLNNEVTVRVTAVFGASESQRNPSAICPISPNAALGVFGGRVCKLSHHAQTNTVRAESVCPQYDDAVLHVAPDVGAQCGRGVAAISTRRCGLALLHQGEGGVWKPLVHSRENRRAVKSLAFHATKPLIAACDACECAVFQLLTTQPQRLRLLARAVVDPPAELLRNKHMPEDSECTARPVVDFFDASDSGSDVGLLILHNHTLYTFQGEKAGKGSDVCVHPESWTFGPLLEKPTVRLARVVSQNRILAIETDKWVLLDPAEERIALVESMSSHDMTHRFTLSSVTCLCPLPPSRSLVVVGFADGTVLPVFLHPSTRPSRVASTPIPRRVPSLS